jgi:guanine nucleotide-binding protein G(I)/G(S)/G(T) subunit beta-1
MANRAALQKAEREVEALKEQLKAARAKKSTGKLGEVRQGEKVDDARDFEQWVFIQRRNLEGHFGKIYTMHWSGHSENVVASASQDMKLIIWDTITQHKLNNISLNSAWTMTCGFEPSNGNLIACGGLDNICSIYNITTLEAEEPQTKLIGHDGYLSCARFIDENNLITSSGDASCIAWDVNRQQIKGRFIDHGGDVMSVSLHPKDPNMFVSGSVDTTAKLWDIRLNQCTHTFAGQDAHTLDVNAVQFLPNGYTFISASDDGSCRLFDVRAYGEVATFANGDAEQAAVLCVCASRSGRLIFAGKEDSTCYVFDALKPGASFHQLRDHLERVSCLGVNKTGVALCTGSWDTHLKVWA